jgi:hypothetical protein
VIVPLVECAPESQVSWVIAHALWVIVHSSSPHDPLISQVPESAPHADGGASPAGGGGVPIEAPQAHRKITAILRNIIMAPGRTAYP